MGFFDGIGDFFKGLAGPAAGALTSMIPGVGGMGQQMIDPMALANMNYVNAHGIQQPRKKAANYFGGGLSGRYFA